MAEYPYDPQMEPRCLCGRHRSQLEHEHEARSMLQCETVANEERRYEGLLAQAAMRMHFPKR
jgi:hypothetical protein